MPVVIFAIILEFFVPIVFIFIFVRAVRLANKKRKSNDENEQPPFISTISNANDENSYVNTVSSEPTEIYCEYCGVKYNKNKNKCPACGAKKSK